LRKECDDLRSQHETPYWESQQAATEARLKEVERERDELMAKLNIEKCGGVSVASRLMDKVDELSEEVGKLKAELKTAKPDVPQDEPATQGWPQWFEGIEHFVQWHSPTTRLAYSKDGKLVHGAGLRSACTYELMPKQSAEWRRLPAEPPIIAERAELGRAEKYEWWLFGSDCVYRSINGCNCVGFYQIQGSKYLLLLGGSGCDYRGKPIPAAKALRILKDRGQDPFAMSEEAKR